MCEANWIRQNQPDIWEKTHKYLLLSGYFTYKLTGEYTDSVGSNVGYLPVDGKTYQWAGKFDIKNLLFPIEREKLPDLVKPAQVMGADHEARLEGYRHSRRTFPSLRRVRTRGCEILGAGCLTPETGCLSFGTTATFNTATKQVFRALQDEAAPYPASVPDAVLHRVHDLPGLLDGKLVQGGVRPWSKKSWRKRRRTWCRRSCSTPLLKTRRPGPWDSCFSPTGRPGSTPSSTPRGRIIGFGDVHNRAYLYRAILEGLIYALREGAEYTEKKSGTKITKIRASGGGSQSDMAMQITADVFGIPAERPHNLRGLRPGRGNRRRGRARALQRLPVRGERP